MGRHALRLYGLIRAKHENWLTHTCSPARRELAKGLNVGMTTLDEALNQLEDAGAVTREQQQDETGNLTVSLYRVFFEAPAPAGGGLPRKRGVGGQPKNRARTTPKKRVTRDDHRSSSDHRSSNLKAPREDASADTACGKVKAKKPRPKEPATFGHAVALVADIRRRFPELDGVSLVDVIKCERLRLGFTADEFDVAKPSPSQVHRAIDAYEYAHPRPRLVVSHQRAPAIAPIDRTALISVDEARRRGLWTWPELWSMPHAHGQAGVTIDADGNLIRAFPYRDVKNYDAALGLTRRFGGPRSADSQSRRYG